MRVHGRESVATTPPQNWNAARGQPPRGRIARVSLTCIVAAKAAQMKASTDSASPSECRACEAWFEARHHSMATPNQRWPAALLLLRRAEGGGGRKSRERVARSSPPAIHSRESPVALAQPQSSGPAKNLHVSLDTTVRHFVASRNTKNGRHCAETVDDEDSLWKPEEISDTILNDDDQFPMFTITYTALRVALRWIANVGKCRF